ncbi:methyltransferase [Oceanospirillum sanctuarii]|uniref:methyltransferase n=1 Tax=Oceanospirillum sanctuarii TaxID=1434821 RepID=UPI000A366607|nr:methyltransferase [Oceanospirillum sanctuarii]
MEQLCVPQGQFQLSRYPHREKDTLRAWDAADEYILNHLADEQIPLSGNILILNDSFGALSTALAAHNPAMMSDSFLAEQGLKQNLLQNGLEETRGRFLNSLETPDKPLDLVLLKIPKSHSMLEEQLHRIRPFVHTGTKIIAGAMTKLVHTNTLKLFERIIGPTKTSLAVKKARLIFSDVADLKLPDNPYPLTLDLKGEQFTHNHYTLSNHANVFSRESMDIGSRFFLQILQQEKVGSDEDLSIVDLGCGNGVVGVIATERFPNAQLHFVDESYMAVDSARINFQRAFPEREARFTATDCLAGLEANSADLILNNPPFHQQNVVGDFIALQMFKESRKVLKKGGALWVVGNRHLGYHAALKRLFGNCTLVASNKKFVVLKAVKR